MDTDGYEGLDFALGEPGLIEDTRIADEAAQAQGGVDADEAIHALLSTFDGHRGQDDPATACLVRFQIPAKDDLGASAMADRILERMKGAIRSPDLCERTDRGDYALALAGCDVDTARKRVALMLRLVQMDPMFIQPMSLWAGIAPVTGKDSSLGLRTALLACDLASFQPSGHVEVIEL